MRRIDFEDLAAHAVDNVFAFADFTKQTEHLFADATDKEGLQAFRNAWFELEVVNATALDEWEADGRPRNWNEKWNGRFLKDALETINMVRAAAQKIAE